MADKKFEKHMMYRDGKAETADTFAEHLKLKKKGYGHKKPPFKLREVNSPMKCWKTHRKVGTKKSPSGKTNPDGSVKMVNDCVKK